MNNSRVLTVAVSVLAAVAVVIGAGAFAESRRRSARAGVDNLPPQRIRPMP